MPGFACMTPADLRKEASETEAMARLVSYGRDKQWLMAKAAELRHQADRLESRSFAPVERESPLARGGTGSNHGVERDQRLTGN